MNDPNGLVYYDGEYHLFYQYHPHSDVWGPMHWGHAVSTDLLHWEHLPIALYPDEHGMIFSGSAVVDVENTAGFGMNALVAIFTYNRDYKESQNLAYSTDRGRTWIKYAGNPVIPPPNPLRDFRDPKVFQYEDHWVMSLAAGNSVEFFTSPDLKNWEQSGTFGGGDHGSTVGVWETPDLFKLTVASTNQSRWVLTVGVGNGGPAGGSGTQYFIGDFDGRTFVSENPKETVLWADHGADYYAPQSWSNEPGGRRIMLGWMSNWQYAREVPSNGWRGIFNLPREVSLIETKGGLRLGHRPIPELRSLRSDLFHCEERLIRPGEDPLNGLQADVVEIEAEIQIQPSTESFGFHLRKGGEERTTLSVDARSHEIFLDRSHSGQSGFHENFPSRHAAALDTAQGTILLHIFLDRCSVEVFANNGLTCLSDLIYPSAESLGLEFFTTGGGVHIRSLDIYHMAETKTH